MKRGYLVSLFLLFLGLAWVIASYYSNTSKNKEARNLYEELCQESIFLDEAGDAKWAYLVSKLGPVDKYSELSIENDRSTESNEIILYGIPQSDRVYFSKIHLIWNGKKYLSFKNVVFHDYYYFVGPLRPEFIVNSCFLELDTKYSSMLYGDSRK